MWRFGERLQRYFLIYLSVSLLGLAFIYFALLYRSTAGLFITKTLFEAAFAFLDLFVWTTLSDLAFIYGAPLPVFWLCFSRQPSQYPGGELKSVECSQLVNIIAWLRHCLPPG